MSAAIAASLTQMSAQISAQRGASKLDDMRLEQIASEAAALSEEAAGLGDADEQAYSAVLAAMALDNSDPTRAEKVSKALSAAADPPARIAELAADIAELAAEVVIGGRDVVRGDAMAGVLLAEAVSCGASHLVELDVESATDPRVSKASAHADRALIARTAAMRG